MYPISRATCLSSPSCYSPVSAERRISSSVFPSRVSMGVPSNPTISGTLSSHVPLIGPRSGKLAKNPTGHRLLTLFHTGSTRSIGLARIRSQPLARASRHIDPRPRPGETGRDPSLLHAVSPPERQGGDARNDLRSPGTGIRHHGCARDEEGQAAEGAPRGAQVLHDAPPHVRRQRDGTEGRTRGCLLLNSSRINTERASNLVFVTLLPP